MRCAGVRREAIGACPGAPMPENEIDGCVMACPETSAPVCGDDGTTYPTACVASCAGVTYEAGQCADLCAPKPLCA